LTTRHSRDPHAGSWLLTPVTYNARTKEKNIYRRVHPAVDQVKSGLSKLKTRHASCRADRLDKKMYQTGLLLGPIENTGNDPIYHDPQAWLSGRLRNGEIIRYTENAWQELPAQYWNF
jgi:hypothetical protein